MIDLHSHILPGLDDGPETAAGAVELARGAVADGARVIAATPHVRHDFPTTPEQMEGLVASTRELLTAAAIRLELLPGAEIALDMLPRLADDDLRRFGLGGNPALLLLEIPDSVWPLGLEDTVLRLRLRGFRSVLAHPERNSDVQRRPDRLTGLVAAETLVQLTAASIDGRLGPACRRTALRLLDLGLAHLVASDAHAPSVREAGLARAAAVIGDDELVRWLTEEVPAAILADAKLPPRPRPAKRRSWAFGLGRRDRPSRSNAT